MREAIHIYSGFVTRHPFIMLLVALLITGMSFLGMMLVATSPMDYSNMLPKDVEEIRALNLVSDEFGNTGDSITIVVEALPRNAGSDEPRDIRSPEAVLYIDLLEKKIRTLDKVVSVSGFPDTLKSLNSGELPKSRLEILGLMGDYGTGGSSAKKEDPAALSPFRQIVSKDYTLTVVRVGIPDLSQEQRMELADEIGVMIRETKKPAGVKVGLTGDAVLSKEVNNLIGPTMQQTSTLSLVGILILVSLLFFSIRKGLISLLAIFFGVIWVYGLVGFLGMSLTPATSGSLSMIMGVGIDFGIQTVNRFSQEARKLRAEKAMEKTLNSTILPMSVTTLAALIGFRAMSLGELTLLADLGTIMSLGILTCFLAAVSIIPPVLILSERIKAMLFK